MMNGHKLFSHLSGYTTSNDDRRMQTFVKVVPKVLATEVALFGVWPRDFPLCGVLWCLRFVSQTWFLALIPCHCQAPTFSRWQQCVSPENLITSPNSDNNSAKEMEFGSLSGRMVNTKVLIS